MSVCSWKEISREKSVVVIVDVQEKLTAVMKKSVVRENVANIALLGEMATHWNIPVVTTVQYVKGLGPTVAPLAAWAQNPIEKMSFSCWGEPKFQATLQELALGGRKQVILVGMEAHICVLETASDLLAQGYQVVIPADGVLSTSQWKWKRALKQLESEGVVITSTESLLFHYAGRADTADFKKLSQRIKENNRVASDHHHHHDHDDHHHHQAPRR